MKSRMQDTIIVFKKKRKRVSKIQILNMAVSVTWSKKNDHFYQE